ncbi:MAG: hypothetical protein ACKVIE_02275 [Candidatus Poseidoniales archaeon]
MRQTLFLPVSNGGGDSSDIFLLGIWATGFLILLISWYTLKDLFIPTIFVFIFSCIILFRLGPSAAPFALCLSSGWILLNRVIESLIPISDSIE